MYDIDLTNEKVIHIRNKENEFLQFKRLKKFENMISHAYSIGINKSYRTFKANREPLPINIYQSNMNNYKTLCSEIGADYKKITKANQAHTDNVVCINNIEENVTIDTKDPSDGLITDKKDIVLATTNADCILLLFFDPVKKVIANTHSGWKGTLQEISVKTVEKMIENYGCKPENIIVCICPSIRKCHFEVGEDVKKMFYDKFEKLGNTDRFIEKRDEKWYVDTILINKLILKNIGILEENIEDSGICSVCNKEQIHSFRAEGESYGLATAIISLIRNCNE